MEHPNFDTKVRSTSRMVGRIKVTSLELLIKNLPTAFNGYRISSLSDFHYGCYTNPTIIESSIKISNDFSPNLVILTGDYIHSGRQEIKLTLLKYLGLRRSGYRAYRRKALESAKKISILLDTLEHQDGILSVWGNHDYMESTWVLNKLLPKKIKHLINDHIVIKKNEGSVDSSLLIFGLDDFREGKPEMSKFKICFEENHDLKFFISHNPDFTTLPESETARNVNLILSGHTHGGQVCFPGGSPFTTETFQNEYRTGFYRFGESPFYIANGIGCSGVPLRLFCPPEMLEITLVAQSL